MLYSAPILTCNISIFLQQIVLAVIFQSLMVLIQFFCRGVGGGGAGNGATNFASIACLWYYDIFSDGLY